MPLMVILSDSSSLFVFPGWGNSYFRFHFDIKLGEERVIIRPLVVGQKALVCLRCFRCLRPSVSRTQPPPRRTERGSGKTRTTATMTMMMMLQKPLVMPLSECAGARSWLTGDWWDYGVGFTRWPNIQFVRKKINNTKNTERWGLFMEEPLCFASNAVEILATGGA